MVGAERKEGPGICDMSSLRTGIRVLHVVAYILMVDVNEMHLWYTYCTATYVGVMQSVSEGRIALAMVSSRVVCPAFHLAAHIGHRPRFSDELPTHKQQPAPSCWDDSSEQTFPRLSIFVTTDVKGGEGGR